MKRLLPGLLFLPLLAWGQVGTFPPLVGARGTANPANCSIGQLFYRTDLNAVMSCSATNTWIQATNSGGSLATPITADNGGTGVANNAAATLTRSGNHALTITTSGTTGVTLPTAGTVCASGNQCTATSFSPSTTSGIIGTTTNDAAAVGSVGQELCYTVASGSAVSLTTSTTANVTSGAFTAGDWRFYGMVNYIMGGTTVTTAQTAGVSIVSATLGANNTFSGAVYTTGGQVLDTNYQVRIPVPYQRLSLSGTTTVYLLAFAVFTTSTMTAHGTICGTRVR